MAKDETSEWISQANEDLETAEYNLTGKKYKAAVFFCQQAAEKAMKAFYIKKFGKLLKVHDIALLAHAVNASEKLIDVCQKLSTYYIAARYPI